MNLFKTKICGITRQQDFFAVVAAGEAHSTAIGLNFYKAGKRYVDPDCVVKWIEDSELAIGDPNFPTLVGVFVNEDVDQIVSITKQLGLKGIQLHGDETPSIVANLMNQLELNQLEGQASNQLEGQASETLIIRAIRTTGDSNALVAAQSEIDEWIAAGTSVILLDAAQPGAYGGTGATLDWENVVDLRIPVPWILAGGLNPTNVARSIAVASPDAVDVASGVETSPGVKDLPMVESFLSNATGAFEEA